MTPPDSWPSAEDVEVIWGALIRGEKTREEVHAWTVTWVERTVAGWHEGLGHVEIGLQTLHGFTMAYNAETPHLIHHGPPGVYVKSDQDIVNEYVRWRQRK